MSRLTIDISPEQHKSLKAMAALEGKTIRQYALERLFPRRAAGEGGPHRSITLDELLDKDESGMDAQEQAAWSNFGAFLEERAAEALAGAASDKNVDQIFRETLEGEGHAFE